jgi:hypothetical protein
VILLQVTLPHHALKVVCHELSALTPCFCYQSPIYPSALDDPKAVVAITVGHASHAWSNARDD